MGYDLHITRKTDWSDEAGPVIPEAEWHAVIAADRELSLDEETCCAGYVFAAWDGQPGVLAYHGGEITAKNPDTPLIAKMVKIAQVLEAEVQGDDGEVYQEDGTSCEPPDSAPPSAHVSLLSRITAWFRHWNVARDQRAAAPAFRVGQRVKNLWGELGTVVGVDHSAKGGLGSVRIRLDDGREQHLACVASGLEILEDPMAAG